MQYSKEVLKALTAAMNIADAERHEFVTPEHLLLVLCENKSFRQALQDSGCNVDSFQAGMAGYVNEMEKVPSDIEYELGTSSQLALCCTLSMQSASSSGAAEVSLPHIVRAILSLEDSFGASSLLEHISNNVGLLMANLITLDQQNQDDGSEQNLGPIPFGEFIEPKDKVFIGRQQEISKVVRILCRKDCNNVLLVGDHGVGKTSIVDKIAFLSSSEDSILPKRLVPRKLFCVNPSLIMSGTEMRGALEKNITTLCERLKSEGNIILVIEDLNSLYSSSGTGSKDDPLGMFSSILLDTDIPVIATATFMNIKKVQGKSSSLDRYFTKIDIEESSIDDTIKIASSLCSQYASFHGVTYTSDGIDRIVQTASTQMAGSLPGKAIRLMDDCGAWAESHPESSLNVLDKNTVQRVISEITGKKLSVGKNDPLDGIADRIKQHIFGQDKAVDAVCTSLLISKAGLSNPQKPLGSFLFIGPTGVGKTQLARTLAEELSENLVRFDMSEYAEKHTVSKFIGSPAGYVGYDDGGLLTDAVRKNPGCVLLLDEIEKAHPDIYNLLLQIMDYGTLTDSKGQKADFRNAVIIMTSNAGARFASQASIGFGRVAEPGNVMEGEAKKVFAPEFLNRLSSVVVFNSLSRDMARRVLDSKIADMVSLLSKRDVRVSFTPAALEELLSLGYSPEYGAREVERILDQRVKPILVEQLLFGFLKDGGKAVVDFAEKFMVSKA